jgi:hypothetical protein
MWRCEPVQHFETVNKLKPNSFSLREKELMRGSSKLTPSPQSSPVEGEEEEKIKLPLSGNSMINSERHI